MSGRPPQPRTRFTRVACGDPGVTVIRISGSLGPRAKPQLVRMTQECMRRNLPRLVLDLSEVDALGGGTARLLNEFAAERAGRGSKTAFRVTSRTVRGFLCADASLPPPSLVASLDEAIAAVRAPASGGRPEASAIRSVATVRPSVDDRSLAAAGPTAGAPVPRGARAPEPQSGGRHVPSLLVPEEDEHAAEAFPSIGRGLERVTAGAAVNRGAFQPSAAEEIFDLDLADVVEEAGDGPVWNRSQRPRTPEELRDRLVTALHARGVASRVFLFQRHPDHRYYLVTRQGADTERGFDVEGALATSVRALPGPGFLVDLDVDALSESEAELLSELNCEVTVALGAGEQADYLLFLSKEQPGDEYGIEELQELEKVTSAAAASLGRREPAARPRLPKPAAPVTAPVTAVRQVDAPWPAEEASHTAPTSLWGSSDLGPDGSETAAPSRSKNPGGTSAPSTFIIEEPERPRPIRVEDPPPGARQRGATPETTRELRRNLAQMRDILSLSQDFDAAFGTSKLLEVLVLSVVSVARVETVLYFAARDGEYRLTHHRGMSPDAIQGLRLRGDASLVQRALAATRGVCIGDDAQITEDERIWARQHGLHYGVPFRFKDEIIGLLLLGEVSEDLPPDLEMLGHLMGQAGLAYDRARLYETLQDRTLGVVRGLITLIEARNGFDCGSTEQVVRYTQALARELQFPAESVRDLIYGAVLRDVGMLQVSEALLRSAADLTGDQWEGIRRHPQEGASIMRQMRFSPVAVDVVLHHHEAYNGEGYPMRLRGRAIPLGARIIAVAESYVKMTMDRPYRKALGKAEALESLAENWGLRYDPLVVDALVRVVNRELSMGLKGDRDLTRDLFGV